MAYLTFQYSSVYNRFIKQRSDNPDAYPDQATLTNYLGDVEKLWRQRGEKVLTIIETRLGIPWDNKEHVCYVMGLKRSFSNPLSLGFLPNTERAFDVLTHEMIHRYFIQRDRKLVKTDGFQQLMQQYADEPLPTKNHVPVHALHQHVYEKLDRQKEMQEEIANLIRDEYKRSWYIVQEVGAEKILDRIAARPR
ncbi:MAG TPA: hypothetical protein VIF43_02045 [Patescibacteria group bacterium]|jgi:hypothetical protein